MSIENDLKELIKNNLPEQTAEAMREFIDNAEETKQQLKDIVAVAKAQLADISDLEIELTQAKEKLGEYRDIEEVNAVLLEREKVVQYREDRQEFLLINKEVGMLRAQSALLETLVGKVFGHPGVVISTRKNLRTAVNGGNGISGFVQQDEVTDTESRTETKT